MRFFVIFTYRIQKTASISKYRIDASWINSSGNKGISVFNALCTDKSFYLFGMQANAFLKK
jgi:aminopeptidase C